MPSGGALDTFRPEKNKAGVITFILSETGFFGVLILAYLFYNATSNGGSGAQKLNVLQDRHLQRLPVCEQLHDLAM